MQHNHHCLTVAWNSNAEAQVSEVHASGKNIHVFNHHSYYNKANRIISSNQKPDDEEYNKHLTQRSPIHLLQQTGHATESL